MIMMMLPSREGGKMSRGGRGGLAGMIVVTADGHDDILVEIARWMNLR
jgi:hypothetical protein